MNKKFHLIVVFIVFILIISSSFLVYAFYSDISDVDETLSTPKIADNSITKQSMYICPMHNHIIKKYQGECPVCGMKLTAITHKDTETDTKAVIMLSDVMQANVSLATSRVERSTLWKYINTLGQVDYDRNRLLDLHTKAKGWIEVLAVNTVGERVSKGQLLYKIYSPDLVAAQDYYLGIFNSSRMNQKLLERAYSRLLLLGITEDIIKKIEKLGDSIDILPFYAPFDGVVSSMNIQEGSYVVPERKMMTLSDTSNLWLVANVFESQIDWVRSDKWAEVDIPALGISKLEAKIEHIYPELDPVTRTLRVHLSLDNTENIIKKNMIANVRIYGGGKKDAIHVPESAVIQSENENRVIVKEGKNRFIPKLVKIGINTQGRIEILDGLHEGEKVVTSGQFLIDSESSIKEAILQMSQRDELRNNEN
jgi:Cu(I)/Ag(I) efflux system membrane fusion protein